jgi:CDP-diacylglycerol--glycerol-3-phosphate 3-phosphatidyltransferase
MWRVAEKSAVLVRRGCLWDLAPLLASSSGGRRPLLDHLYSTTSLESSGGGEFHAKRTSDLLASFAKPVSVSTSKIRVLREPAEFYDLLLESVSAAKDRITISTLYFGISTEKELRLLDMLAKAARRGVRVRILVDALRARRVQRAGTEHDREITTSIAKKLAHVLLREGKGATWQRESIGVSLYHTPRLKGLLKSALKPPYSEILGVMHMKAYLFDDRVIVSGANLNEQYFTTRQDRYMSLEDSQLADVVSDVVDVISSYSFQLSEEGRLEKPPSGIDPVSSPKEFSVNLHADLTSTLEPTHKEVTSGGVNRGSSSIPDQRVRKHHAACGLVGGGHALVFPLIQLGCIGYRQDERALSSFLQSICSPEDRLQLSSGYLNLTHQLERSLAQTQAAVDFITASPSANGFFNSSEGSPKALIPFVYQALAEDSLGRMRQCYPKRKAKVALYEYKREAWQYHAKGLWYTPSGHTAPQVTFIGSPNYGYRSLDKDLEMQLCLITSCTNLRRDLKQEVDALFEHASRVTREERRVAEEQVPLKEKLFISLSSKLCRKWL